VTPGALLTWHRRLVQNKWTYPKTTGQGARRSRRRSANWRREDAWKTAEILILRHQVAVLQQRQPCRLKLNWADRAMIAALIGLIPKARRQGLRLLVTPDTIVRWHRDIVRRRWAARSTGGKTGRPTTRRNIEALVRRLARENPGWGYRRIPRRASRLGHQRRSIAQRPGSLKHHASDAGQALPRQNLASVTYGDTESLATCLSGVLTRTPDRQATRPKRS
jgi:hypothetical protein